MMLEVRNLVCGYDSRFILKDINCTVETGEVVGIVGPNGSGKTTFLRAITKVLKPKSGTILLEGRDVWQMHFKELAKKVAVVSQDSETGYMSVEEFVLLGRIPYYTRLQFLETKGDLDSARKCMVLTDTLKLKDRLMRGLSGGERQLVFIARALAQEPKLLLLDEPTTHLDITHQVSILNLIRKLNRKFGLTVIMVLHDLNLASEYCDRLILINEGQIYQSGSPEQVLNYRTIEEVYRTLVVVKKSPVSSKPYIFVVSKDKEEKQRGNHS